MTFTKYELLKKNLPEEFTAIAQ